MGRAAVTAPFDHHGGDGHRVAAALGLDPATVLDLSVSLNPFAPDVVRLAGHDLDALSRYPEPTSATAMLAEVLGAEPERVVLTNGGSEAIALVAAECPVGRVDDPEFSLYRRHLDRISPSGPRWRSNPHNPSGRLAAGDEDAAVWDEAFYPLATGSWTRGDRGAVVVGSLTKTFSCPGLRLGYAVAPDDELAARLRARQPTWSVNALALAVLPRLLAAADLVGWARRIAGLRTELAELLRSFGLMPQPSDANWVLVPEACSLRDRLLPLGIVVRDTASFGIPHGARIAVPDEDGLQRLAAALRSMGP